MQDTLLKAILHKDKFVSHTNLEPWLYTIMKNPFINNYRKKVRRKTVFDSTKAVCFFNIASQNSVLTPESRLVTAELLATIEALPEVYKLPLKMYMEVYKYKEIAQDLDFPLGTGKSIIFLANAY